MQDYVNKSELTRQAYANWAHRSEAFKNRLWDQHVKLDTIMQRHFKWGKSLGKDKAVPVWEGPLRDEMDDLDADQLREYVIVHKDRNDVKARHIIEPRKKPLLEMGLEKEEDVEEAESPEPSPAPAPKANPDEPVLPDGVEWPDSPVARQFAIEWYKEMIKFPLDKRKWRFKDAMRYWKPKNAKKHGHDKEDAEYVYNFFQQLKDHYLAGEDLELAGGGVDPNYDGPGDGPPKGMEDDEEDCSGEDCEPDEDDEPESHGGGKPPPNAGPPPPSSGGGGPSSGGGRPSEITFTTESIGEFPADTQKALQEHNLTTEDMVSQQVFTKSGKLVDDAYNQKNPAGPPPEEFPVKIVAKIKPA